MRPLAGKNHAIFLRVLRDTYRVLCIMHADPKNAKYNGFTPRELALQMGVSESNAYKYLQALVTKRAATKTKRRRPTAIGLRYYFTPITSPNVVQELMPAVGVADTPE